MNPIRLLLLCGGRSAEHEISLISGWNVCNKLEPSTEFSITLLTIDKNGDWYLQEVSSFLKQKPHAQSIHFGKNEHPILCKPGGDKQKFYDSFSKKYLPEFDVVFPLIHGPNGEDGSVQGLLEHLQLPYIGPGVLGSALCMDKVVAKQLMMAAEIPTSDFVVAIKGREISFKDVEEKLGLPVFIKPANMGSSVGVSKVNNEDEFQTGLTEAFLHDSKVIIEAFVDGIEVECAVLGNEKIQVSRAGTYSHSDEFFDFDTKYIKDDVTMEIPAKTLTETEQNTVQELSKKAYETLNCSGLARVDTFFTTDRKFMVNEINTIPGFTQHSMYPILMEDRGLPYIDLLKKLCELAIAKYKLTNAQS